MISVACQRPAVAYRKATHALVGVSGAATANFFCHQKLTVVKDL